MNPILLPPFAAEFVDWLRSRFPEAAPAALAAAGLCALRADEGHVCLDLADEAGVPWNGLSLPPLVEWRASLLDCGFVADAGGYAPLVLDGDRLYLGRLWSDEVALAEGLRCRAGASRFTPEAVRRALDPFFADAPADDGQRRAAATALLNRVALIAGGPGTGKTTTVAKVLAAQAQLWPDCRVRLAAPTGKAAARMVEALAEARERLGFDLVTAAALPTEATTVHRLLGFRPDSALPRHGPDNPLALDLLVVDEASMIDQALFARLVAALPAQAHLLLLGDPDQLAAVEAGNCFAELACLGAVSHAGAIRLAGATGAAGPKDGVGDEAVALADGVAWLSTRHRFGGAIGELAELANTGDGPAALALLQSGRPELTYHSGRMADWLPTLLAALEMEWAPYRAAVAAGDVDVAWAAFNRLRLLCALREGPAGVVMLNRLVEARLWRADTRRSPWYAGRPVIVRSNVPGLGLANGDVGLTLPGPDGLRVHFPGPEGWRALAPARLPRHDTAFALTVHQSQGSEFHRVWLLLPDEDALVLGRGLVYTALTRARSGVGIWGPPGTLATAIRRVQSRRSGLAARLAVAG